MNSPPIHLPLGASFSIHSFSDITLWRIVTYRHTLFSRRSSIHETTHETIINSHPIHPNVSINPRTALSIRHFSKTWPSTLRASLPSPPLPSQCKNAALLVTVNATRANFYISSISPDNAFKLELIRIVISFAGYYGNFFLLLTFFFLSSFFTKPRINILSRFLLALPRIKRGGLKRSGNVERFGLIKNDF